MKNEDTNFVSGILKIKMAILDIRKENEMDRDDVRRAIELVWDCIYGNGVIAKIEEGETSYWLTLGGDIYSNSGLGNKHLAILNNDAMEQPLALLLSGEYGDINFFLGKQIESLKPPLCARSINGKWEISRSNDCDMYSGKTFADVCDRFYRAYQPRPDFTLDQHIALNKEYGDLMQALRDFLDAEKGKGGE